MVAENFIERMTWPQVDQRIKKGVDAVMIPIGTTEQHGPHMPLDTDCFIARSLAERAAGLAEEQGLSVLVAPTLNVTLSWYHMQFPGSIRLSTTTFFEVFREICDSLVHHGFERLVAVNGHAGNIGVLTAALGDTTSSAIQVEVVSYWTLVDARRMADACLSDAGGVGHAGEVETSIALALEAGLAVNERLPAPPGRALVPGEPGGPPAGGIVRSPRPLLESPSGVYGDPSQARPELGELVLAEASSALARHLDRPGG